MNQINITDAQQLFTKKLIATYIEKNVPKAFLRSFFREETTNTKEISIEVQRGSERIAVDVVRGTGGNRNTFSKSTEKVFIPPYFREYFDATELDFYDRLFGTSNGSIDALTFSEWTNRIVDKIIILQSKIERRQELNCASVFRTGVVTMKNGTTINYNRKAASMVDVDTLYDYWNTAGGDPYRDLENGCKFLREQGKMMGSVVNCIMGGAAWNAFQSNAKVIARADVRRISLDDVHMPQKNSVGASLHATVAAGPYTVNIWTYPEVYDDPDNSNASTPYISDLEFILLPENPNFVESYAGVPKSIKTGSDSFPVAITRVAAKYLVGQYVDERNEKHIIDIKSAPLPVPVAVDQIYTAQVLTS